jgi:hypothetical protein
MVQIATLTFKNRHIYLCFSKVNEEYVNINVQSVCLLCSQIFNNDRKQNRRLFDIIKYHHWVMQTLGVRATAVLPFYLDGEIYTTLRK